MYKYSQDHPKWEIEFLQGHGHILSLMVDYVTHVKINALRLHFLGVHGNFMHFFYDLGL